MVMAIGTDMEKSKKNNKLFYLYIFLIIVIAVSIVIMLCFHYYGQTNVASNDTTEDYHHITYNGEEYQYNSSIVSILLLGIDTSDPTDTQGQADVLELLLLDRTNKTMQVISIPRDTMTEIRLYDVEGNSLGWQEHHINLSYAYANNARSGCMRTSQAVSRMLGGIPIVYYASLNLNMLGDIQNIIGILDVTLPNDSLEDVNESWSQGTVLTVDSSNVETYLRYRNSDIDFSNNDRMERQKEYMLAYFEKINEMLNTDFNQTVESMYSIINEMTTNISYDDLQVFANMVLEYSFDEEKNFYTLEGENVSGAFHDEYILDQDKLETKKVELFYTKE